MVRLEPEKIIDQQNEWTLRGMAGAAFCVFFNGYLIAPLIPSLAHEFGTTEYRMGWVVPAYLVPYGLATLIYGAVADHFGKMKVLLILLVLASLSMALTACAWSANSLIGLRILAGICAGGVMPTALAIVGDLYPYKKLGRAMGWMFGAVAGGIAFGSSFGAWLNPTVGWRHEFLILAIVNTAVFGFLFARRRLVTEAHRQSRSVGDLILGYFELVKNLRGARTFAFIFLNGVFHGGVFAWLGYYLAQRYHLTDAGIGRALLGYGIPGIFLGPPLGRLADKFGRRRIIPCGFVLAAGCALALIPLSPLWLITVIVTCLSTGFDMSHPLMAGIIASLDPQRRGQAMGLNAFAIFLGFGLGAMLFQNLILAGLNTALLVFGSAQLALGLSGFKIFNAETTR